MPTRAEVVSELGEWLDWFSVEEKDGYLSLYAKPGDWIPDDVFKPLMEHARQIGGNYDSVHRAIRIPLEYAAPQPASQTENSVEFTTADRLDGAPKSGPPPIRKQPKFTPPEEIPRRADGRFDIPAYSGLKEPEKQVEKPTPDNGYRLVGLDMLVSSPFQPRLEVDEPFLEELVGSIRDKGVLVPLLVRRLASGNYEVVDGNTTLRAAKILELKAVPVIIQELDDQAAMEVAYQRNNTRRDWSDYERARFLNEYGRRFGLNQEQIATKTGATPGRVSQLFAMVKAEDRYPKQVLSRLNEWQFRSLESLPAEKREEAVTRIGKGEADITAVINQAKPDEKFTAVKNESKPDTSKGEGESESRNVTSTDAGESPSHGESQEAPAPRQTTGKPVKAKEIDLDSKAKNCPVCGAPVSPNAYERLKHKFKDTLGGLFT